MTIQDNHSIPDNKDLEKFINELGLESEDSFCAEDIMESMPEDDCDLIMKFDIEHSAVIKDAVLAIENMDIAALNEQLSSSFEYNDMPKNEFLVRLNDVFVKFINAGDTKLTSYIGHCKCCYKGRIGYMFVGNKSGLNLNMIFDYSFGIIKDMHSCHSFGPHQNGIKYVRQLAIYNPNDSLDFF